ncbi:hypothetical protein BDZ90DRAFT_67161 [Jaminaea rosea]|uniref:Uncharacterized protein n=1 Tax=Jaminaea rosea TaxID=1569628 RepID=A0A316UQW0_9BASI|nr:hypothetical protein BDZ90DRAFT_67161 [Jaminaea rosea]PWN25515.1 hypothetical protein BDZ90DRAFT_67161 [Jaminaea rosea]
MDARRGAYIAFHAAMRPTIAGSAPPARRSMATTSAAASSSFAPRPCSSSSSSSPLVTGELSALLFDYFKQKQQRQEQEQANEFASLPAPFSVPPTPVAAPGAAEGIEVASPPYTRQRRFSAIASIDRALHRGDVRHLIKCLRTYDATAKVSRSSLLPSRSSSFSNQVPSADDLVRWTYQVRDLLKSGGIQSRAPISSGHSSAMSCASTCTDAATLASFALANIFDAHHALGYAPEEGMISVLLSVLAHSMFSVRDYDEVVQLAFQAYREGQVGEREELPRAMLSAAIVGYGRLGSPGSGEWLLARCAHACAKGEPLQHAALDLPLDGGWTRDHAIWCALVRSRCLAGDMAGAQRWLGLYRDIYHDGSLPLEARPGKLHDKVYLTLMVGFLQAEPAVRCDEAEVHATRVQRRGLDVETERNVRSIVATMRSDSVRPSTAMLNFLIGFERRCEPAASSVASHRICTLARLVEEGKQPRANQWDGHKFQTAFEDLGVDAASSPSQDKHTLRWLLTSLAQLHNRALWKKRVEEASHSDSPSGAAGTGRYYPAPTPRPTRYLRSATTLRSAFWAALRCAHSAQDLATALFVLSSYKVWGYGHVLDVLPDAENGEQQQLAPGHISEAEVRQYLTAQGYAAARIDLNSSPSTKKTAIQRLLEEALLERLELSLDSALPPSVQRRRTQERKEALAAALSQVEDELIHARKKSKERRRERRRVERQARQTR